MPMPSISVRWSSSCARRVAAVARRSRRSTSRRSSSPSARRSSPGQTDDVALRLKMADGWHTYWQNPGDSGLPTTITWTLPAGVTRRADPMAGAARAARGPARQLRLRRRGPAPDRRPRCRRTRRSGKPSTLKAQGRVAGVPRDVHSRGSGRSPSSCRSPSAPTRIRNGAARSRRRATRCRARCRAGRAAPRATGRRSSLTLTAPAGAATPANVHFFPYQEGRIEPAGKQTFVRDANGTFVLTLPVANQLAPGFTQVAGVLTSSTGFAAAARRCAR